MSMTTLAQVHAMLPGSQLIHADMESARAISISGVGSDSRQIQSGELFIALSGERFNAHHFLGDVAAAGAGAALISDKQLCPENLAAVCVQDVKQGLGEFGKGVACPVFHPSSLVTGSTIHHRKRDDVSIFKAAAGEEHTFSH